MVHESLKSAPGTAGFTLSELVIVIAVVSIAALVFAGTFIEGVRSYQFVDAEKGLVQDIRHAEDRIERELLRLRDARSVRIATATTLSFVDKSGGTVSISWSGVPGADLLFTRDGSSAPLARGVDSLALAYWRSDGASAKPIVAPEATDVRRVTVYLRLVKGTQSVSSMGGMFVRAL